MNRIQVLDCTLRDGGYCNEWRFGYNNIKKIIKGLLEADIDFIECGFLTDKVEGDSDCSKFTSIEEIKKVLPEQKNGKIFVAMVNFGEYDLNKLPQCDGNSLDGIRVAFHKKDMVEALAYCKAVKEKGYKVFIQAMVTLSYREDEFLAMIKMVNEFNPYAFYIVDSFGVMKAKELVKIFHLVEENLDEKIIVGFHSHNNMQLSYSNAQTLLQIKKQRAVIIDSSVYGMGRGAGNLNTELFVEYLNGEFGKNYEITPLLTIIDEVLNDFYQRNYWGYSLANYISAVHNAHPNYASFLDNKKTLSVVDMNNIFCMMTEDKKVLYEKRYIEELYEKYMTRGDVQENRLLELKANIENRKILLIAPGKSSAVEKARIIDFIAKEKAVVISINFEYSGVKPDYIFSSNIRRFKMLNDEQKNKCIATSNIYAEEVYLQTKYSDLLNDEESVRDNAGLMAIKFFMKHGAQDIYLAGFDGYTHDETENYGDSTLAFVTKNDVLDAMNKGMKTVLSEYSKNINLEFLTENKYFMVE